MGKHKIKQKVIRDKFRLGSVCECGCWNVRVTKKIKLRASKEYRESQDSIVDLSWEKNVCERLCVR